LQWYPNLIPYIDATYHVSAIPALVPRICLPTSKTFASLASLGPLQNSNCFFHHQTTNQIGPLLSPLAYTFRFSPLFDSNARLETRRTLALSPLRSFQSVVLLTWSERTPCSRLKFLASRLKFYAGFRHSCTVSFDSTPSRSQTPNKAPYPNTSGPHPRLLALLHLHPSPDQPECIHLTQCLCVPVLTCSAVFHSRRSSFGCD